MVHSLRIINKNIFICFGLQDGNNCEVIEDLEYFHPSIDLNEVKDLLSKGLFKPLFLKWI